MIDWQIYATRTGAVIATKAGKGALFIDAISSWFNNATKDFEGLAPTILSAFITGSIALIALRTNAAVNLRNKRVDVIINCNARYDDLYKFKISLVQRAIALTFIRPPKAKTVKTNRSELKEDLVLYFRRFWGMKSDQLDYWLSGYIDPETLISWFMSTIDAIHNPVDAWKGFPVAIGGGWEEVRKFHEVTNPKLFEVVELISQPRFEKMLPDDRYAELFQLFQKIERAELTLIRMLTRNSHARLTMARFEGKLPYSTAGALRRMRGRELAIALGFAPRPSADLPIPPPTA